eukprot:362401-Chlamydomonas_euryale.AAC.1
MKCARSDPRATPRAYACPPACTRTAIKCARSASHANPTHAHGLPVRAHHVVCRVDAHRAARQQLLHLGGQAAVRACGHQRRRPALHHLASKRRARHERGRLVATQRVWDELAHEQPGADLHAGAPTEQGCCTDGFVDLLLGRIATLMDVWTC